MKEFLIENWRTLSCLLLALINIILVICKKSKFKMVDGLWCEVLKHLPGFIQNAEIYFSSGLERKQHVIDFTCQWISFNYDMPLHLVIREYSSKISDAIENILACPQKKGEK